MLTTILIFIIILGVLVFVHEFGHFIVAKKSGMVVEEFGFGFPPRIVGIQKIEGKWKMVWGRKKPQPAPAIFEGEGAKPTIYSINAIPLGGFVKIFGENNEHEGHPGSFINKGFWPRFFTLVAGVLMNVVLAWVLISTGYIVGLPAAITSPSDIPANASFSDPQVAILDVQKGLPADQAGIKPSDIIVSLDGRAFTEVSEIQNYVAEHAGTPITFKVKRGKSELDLQATPNLNPKPDEGATGIELALVGRLKYPFYLAFWEGAQSTYFGLEAIVTGIYSLIVSRAGLSSLGGPVQIARLTGQVADLGFVYLLQFTAFLSLNLAVLNILPFPALDGGRVLFLIIEKIRGKKNNQKVEQIVNTAGFVFLLLLMVVVTVNDIIRK